MKLPLTGRVALVTGAGVRIGREIALKLAQAGAKVAIHCHTSVSQAEEVRQAIRQAGGEGWVCPANLRKTEEIQRLVELCSASIGPVDILVNNAGVLHQAPMGETSVAVLDEMWEMNIRAPYLLTQCLAKTGTLRDVVNIVDIGGTKNVWRNASAYCMTKSALKTQTECLALELAPAVRVNAVALGMMIPPQNASAEVLERLREAIPLHRWGSAQEAAEAVLSLLSGPTFIIGHTLVIDGGRSLNSRG